MFGFLKKKLKDAVEKFTKKAEEEIVEEPEEKLIVKKEIKKEKTRKTPEVKPKKLEVKKETKEEPDKKIEEKKGFLEKIFRKEAQIKDETEEPPKNIFEKIKRSITSVSLSENKFEELFWDFELALLENNVAVEVVEKIKNDLKQDLVNKKIQRNYLNEKIMSSLKHSIEDLFNVEQIDVIKNVKKKKPYVIVIIGVNGSGKTTTLAKIVHLLKKNKLEPVVAACDTFRAAAIQQLEEHTDRLGVKLIKHDYGSDPAAVAYDAVEHAKSKKKDVVLIDTAGRLHSNKNLMQELEKVIRIAKPDLKIFVGESIAGNDVVEQVKLFNDKVGIDAIVLAKADIDEKGGAAISVSYITGKPIIYLGMGQGYDDLVNFDKQSIMDNLGLP